MIQEFELHEAPPTLKSNLRHFQAVMYNNLAKEKDPPPLSKRDRVN